MDYDYTALKAELVLPAYKGLIDTTVAALLVANTISVAVDVPVVDVESYLALNGRLSALADWLVANPTPSAARTYAIELLGILNRPRIQIFHTSDPTTFSAVRAMFTALIAAGAGGITQADAIAIFAGAGAKQSRAQQLGFGGLTATQMLGHIAAARLWG